MEHLIVVLCICSAAARVLPTSCGIGSDEREKRIVGGDVSDYGDWPWLVSVRLNPHYGRELGEGEVTHVCGGTLIHEKFILTAAHCVTYNSSEERLQGSHDPNDYTIRVGEYNRTIVDSYEMDVKVKTMHLYNGTDYDTVDALFRSDPLHDVALFELVEPLKMDNEFVQPICLPKGHEVPMPGEILTTIGWGHTSEDKNNELSDVVREVEIPVAERETCRESIAQYTESEGRPKWTVPPDTFCVGAEEGGRDSCWYDSGGPIMQKIDGRWFLKGVVSIGFGCGRPKHYGLYMRVDHVLPWIENIIENAV